MTRDNASMPNTDDSDLLAALQPDDQSDMEASLDQSVHRRWLVLRIAIVLLVLGAAVVGFAMLLKAPDDAGYSQMLTHPVERGDLLVTVTEDGTIESAENVQIKCEISGGTTILWLIEDGIEVEKGTLLARLDSSQLDEDISQQKISVEKARASYVQAEKDFNVAKIAIREYLEGTYEQELQTLEANITIAREELSSAENTLQYTQRMFRKGYATVLQRDAKEFAVERAKLDLESAITAKKVLTDFTRAKMLEDLNSQRDTAEAQMKSEKASLELEEARLQRLETEKKKCEIHAPKAGMVVYANDMSRHGPPGSREVEIEEGAAVREQQDIFRLPDLSRMQVKTAVHETKVGYLQPGMRAIIRVLDRELPGKVVSVASQPEPTSFMSANIKEYATIVRIEGQYKELRPGMTAEVEILVAHRENVCLIPIAALVEQRGKFFCWVKKDGKVERRAVVLGATNNKSVEIKDGVTEGELVVLNPRAAIDEAGKTTALNDDDETNSQRFGTSDDSETTSPTDPQAGPSPQAPVPGTAMSAAPGSAPPMGAGPPSGMPAGAMPGGMPSGMPGAMPGGMAPGGMPPQGAAPGRMPPGAGSGPSGRRGRPDFSVMDKDGDGRVSREEAPGPMANFFDSIDTNGDGFIDRKEDEALRKRFANPGAAH